MKEMDVDLVFSKGIIMIFQKVIADLQNPCENCSIKTEKCPVKQCKSDRDITICKAKTLFKHAQTTLEYISDRKIKFVRYKGKRKLSLARALWEGK